MATITTRAGQSIPIHVNPEGVMPNPRSSFRRTRSRSGRTQGRLPVGDQRQGDYPSQTIGAFRQMLDELEQELRSGARDAEQGRDEPTSTVPADRTNILKEMHKILGRSLDDGPTITPQHSLDPCLRSGNRCNGKRNTDRTNTRELGATADGTRSTSGRG